MPLKNVLSSEYYLLTFLPPTHPQSYLPMIFRMWGSFNSYVYDERMLAFLAQLAEMHVDPTVSDPKNIDELPDDAVSEGEGRPNWPKDDLKHQGPWTGLYQDVGIFTEDEWNLIMVKCLASMGLLLCFSPLSTLLTQHIYLQRSPSPTQARSQPVPPSTIKLALK